MQNFGYNSISLPNSDVFNPSPFNFYYRKNLSDIYVQKTELFFNNVLFSVGIIAASQTEIFLFHDANGRKILKVTNFGSYPTDAFILPSLANLATSNWNKYHNRF